MEKLAQTTEILKEIRDQNLSFSIAVEGGGLRGVVSGGFLAAIEDFGLGSGLKAISGTSAGALNAAYFLDHKLETLLEIYQHIASPYFIQPWRWPDAMNLKYLFETVIPSYPQPFKQNLQATINFYVSMTDVTTGLSQLKKVQNAQNEQELIRYFKASASAPLYSTNQETINGITFNDGHVGQAVPFEKLLNEKCDYVLCLLTQKRGYLKKQSFKSNLLAQLALKKYSQDYKTTYLTSHQVYNQQLNQIFSDQQKKIIPICLEEEDFIVSKMCWSPEKIKKCWQSAYNRLKQLLK